MGLCRQLRADIEALAAIERPSASRGERDSAEWIAARLREVGAEHVRLQPYRYQGTFAQSHALHYASGVLAALGGNRVLAAAALASFELDYSGRAQWLRRLLPAADGVNVVGRLPARGERRRALVLVAHHDAARTGLMWEPRLLALGDRIAARTGRRASYALVPELAFVGAVLGLRRLPAALLMAAVALSLDQARSPVVPGANDNASGVAAMLELVRRLAHERPDDMEVTAVAPGGEEAGMGGMRAWLADARPSLSGDGTLVLGLDTVGSGEPVALASEGGVWAVRYGKEEVTRAERAGLRSWRLGGWTDPVLARLAGLRAISILSVREGGIPNYHLPSDVPDQVDLACVERCVEAAHTLATTA
ncbi:MAG TPA: M28 family peptidase [Thermoleophilaceae bacterium]|nr:M28 family peptidase [Thermoleophilaceae bacterium]